MERIGAFEGSQAAPDGTWTNGDPQTGTAPTIPRAGWLNLLTEALIGILGAAGIARGKDPGLLLRAVRTVAGNLPGRRLVLREIREPAPTFPYFRLTGPARVLDEREWPDLVPRWRNIKLSCAGVDAFAFSGTGDGSTVTLQLAPGDAADLALEVLARDLLAAGSRPLSWHRTLTIPEAAGDLTPGDYRITGLNETRRELQIQSAAVAMDPGMLEIFPHRIPGTSTQVRHFGPAATPGGWRAEGTAPEPGMEIYEFAGGYVPDALPAVPALQVRNGGFRRALLLAGFDGAEPAQAFNIYWAGGRLPSPADHDGAFRLTGPGPVQTAHDGLTENEQYFYVATVETTAGESEHGTAVEFFEETLPFAEFNVPGSYTLFVPEHIALSRARVIGGGGGGGAGPGESEGGAGGRAGEASQFLDVTAAGGGGGGGGGAAGAPGSAGQSGGVGFEGGAGGNPAESGSPGQLTDAPPFRDEGVGGAGAEGAGGRGGRGDSLVRVVSLTPGARIDLVVGGGGAGGEGPGDPGQPGGPGLVLLEI